MPHVIVKLWPGKSESQKARLAEKIVQDVMEALDYGKESSPSPWKKSNRRIGQSRFMSLTSRRNGTSSTRNPNTPCEAQALTASLMRTRS